MTSRNAAPVRQQPPPYPPALEDTQPIQVPDHGAERGAERGPSLGAWLGRLLMLALTGLALLLILLVLFIAAHETQYAARIYPGVSAFGVNLSGLSYDEAIRALDARFDYDDQAVFTFRYGADNWTLTAGQLGVFYDVRGTVETAMLLGRGDDLPANLITQAEMWFNGRTIPPVIVYDQTVAERLLREIAAQIDRPAVEATIALDGTRLVTTPSQIGYTVDVPAMLDTLRARILALEVGGEMPLIVHETLPAVGSVAEAETQLRAALAGPLVLRAESTAGEIGPWVVAPDVIATMLVLERVATGDGAARYDAHLDPQQLLSALTGIAPQLQTEPQPARYDFDPATGMLNVLQASVDGRALNVEVSLARIEQALFAAPSGDAAARDVQLAFDLTPPTVHSGATAAELGIVELVAEATTYYLGSTAARQTNIAEAAARFNGVVIGPNAEFSFNEWLGDVSLESGFEESLIILNGRTIPGVGGGVCQVSTTVFQAAFYAGFPILERVPHGYRVGYYEYGEGVGMDATVYTPLVDFRFLNDTPYHLLIETEANPEASTITFRLYSTDAGREVVKLGPRVENVVGFGDPVYEENPDLLPGQVRQVEWAVDGADVTVTRQVFRNGQLEFEDHFFSHYLPWNAVYQVAPGHIPADS